MRIFVISDLHMSTACEKPMDIFGGNWAGYLEKIFENWKSRVAEEDVVLLAGDLSWAMNLQEALQDIELLKNLPGRKVILKGNHDYWWSGIGKVRESLPENFYAVQNDCIRIDDLLLCGSRGWICPSSGALNAEDNKIYLRETERLRLSLQSMQKMRREKDKVVCMMHFPPFNVIRSDNAFTELITEYKPDAVVYGHLHGKDCRADLKVFKGNIWYYLTSCDLVDNKLIELKL